MGRGGWQDERPTRATVRHLYGDEAKGSGAITSDEWYETERLTGQITGRRDAPAIDQPAPLQSEALAVLDWRHADSAPALTVLQRLGRSLADRRHRIASRLVLAGHRSRQAAAPGPREVAAGSQPHARRSRLAMLTTRRAVAHGTAEVGEDKQTADEVLAAELSSRRADPRGSGDLAPQRLGWRSAPAPKPRRERRTRPSPRMLTGAALVVTAAAMGVTVIASRTNDRSVSSHSARFAAASSAPGAASSAAAKTVRTVLGTVEQQARTAPARDHGNPLRAHSRRRTRHLARHRHSQTPEPPAASQAAPQVSAGSGTQTATVPSASTGESVGGSTSGGVGSSTGSSQQASSASAPSSAPAQPTGAAGALGPIGSPNG